MYLKLIPFQHISTWINYTNKLRKQYQTRNIKGSGSKATIGRYNSHKISFKNMKKSLSSPVFVGPTKPPEKSLRNISCKRRNVTTLSSSHVTSLYDMNNNKKQSNSRKEGQHYQRVLPYKNIKHSKTIQRTTSSKLVNKSKIQSDDLNFMRQQFLDDVGLGILKFYRAAAKVTSSRYQKSTEISYKNNNINKHNNLTHNDKHQNKPRMHTMKKQTEDEPLEDEIFYSMKPEDILPIYTQQDAVSIHYMVYYLRFTRMV